MQAFRIWDPQGHRVCVCTFYFMELTPLPDVGQTLEFLLNQERDKMAIGDYAPFVLLLGIN